MTHNQLYYETKKTIACSCFPRRSRKNNFEKCDPENIWRAFAIENRNYRSARKRDWSQVSGWMNVVDCFQEAVWYCKIYSNRFTLHCNIHLSVKPTFSFSTTRKRFWWRWGQILSCLDFRASTFDHIKIFSGLLTEVNNVNEVSLINFL